MLPLQQPAEKPVQVVLLPQAEKFLELLVPAVRKKLFFAFRKTQLRLFGDWFKKLKGTDDIFEFRIVENRKCYRVFAFWDWSDDLQTRIVCTHGFIKKSEKTPLSEIHHAELIKSDFYKKKANETSSI